MTESILDVIEDILIKENIDSQRKSHSLHWLDNMGAENEILSYETATDGNKIAWWQRNENGNEIVKIKLENDLVVSWYPPINTMGTHSNGCSFIQFYQQFLIVKYRDKHRERAFIINSDNLQVEEIMLEGRVYEFKLHSNQLMAKEKNSGEQFNITFDANQYIQSPLRIE